MSTNRYLNAGAPGTGTTVDNMASRVKAWANISQAGTQAINNSLNVSSVTDGGVGVSQANYTSPFSTSSTAFGAATTFNGLANARMLVGTWSGTSCSLYSFGSVSGDTAVDGLVFATVMGALV